MNPCRVLVLGATASGTTTLARALANRWSVPHADTDDYFWVPTDPPYTEKRPEEQRLRLMQEMFLPRSAWVLSGSVMGWGEPLGDPGQPRRSSTR
jgi:adenylate kinase family enzyme